MGTLKANEVYEQPMSDFYQQWMQSYQDTYINRDIAKLFPRLNKVAYQRFLGVLGNL